METHVFNKLFDFLFTYTPREEKIIRYKFGIGVARKSDIEIINMFQHYIKTFTASQLRRHYEFIEKSVFSAERKNYKVIFVFKANQVYFQDAEMRAQFEVLQAIGEIYTTQRETF